MAVIEASSGSLHNAVYRAQPHDEILIRGTVEIADSIAVQVPLSFSGVGDSPTIMLRGLCRSGRGLLCTHNDTTITNIEFRGARALSGNAAGVWHEAGHLSLADCAFVDNQNGVMVAENPGSTVRIVTSRFVRNGGGCGHTHGLYVNQSSQVVVDRCSFETTFVGHHLKSRAQQTEVTRSYFSGGSDCTASYAVDLPYGGVATVRQNQFIKGRQSMSRRFISYLSERRVYQDNRLDVSSNIFINHRRGPCIAVANSDPRVKVISRDNAFERIVFPLWGRGTSIAARESQSAIYIGVQ